MNRRWLRRPRETAVHVVPVGDWIAHELDEDCVCGPRAELVPHDGGVPDSWVIVHAALDGRP